WKEWVTKVVITSPDDGCRVWHQILNETHFEPNVTIVRYKLLSDVCLGGLEIALYGDPNRKQVLARKVVTEDVWSERCVCRRHDWSYQMKCQQMAQQFTQIDSDLRFSPLDPRLSVSPIHWLSCVHTFNTSDGIDFDRVLAEMQTRFAPHKRSYSFCHYQIIDNEAYKQCFGEYVGFSQFMDEILRSLLSKTSLPDLEFVSNLGDWPLSDKRTEPPLPVFSWCGSNEFNDIVIPTYVNCLSSEVYVQNRPFGRQSMAFDHKKEMLFWRGRDSNEYRLKLVELSRNHTNLINASLTNFFFFRDQMEALGPKSPYIPFFEFFRYKYQMNIDGTVAAYRLPYLLAGNSLVFKQDSSYYEFFYNLLEPYVHYIPVHKELNDLIQSIDQVMQNPHKSHQIIANSRQLVLNNLLPEHIYCYHFNLFRKYSKLLTTRVQLRPQMMRVFNETDVCKCAPNLRHEHEFNAFCIVSQPKGRITVDILSVFGRQSMAFDHKKEMLFWRGRDSNEYRLKLVELSRKHTNLINASLTNFFFFRDQMEALGPKSPYIPFFEFFRYKYQMNIDGTVAAYRLPYLLAGNSLVFKQDSSYYEFFYNLLEPYVHYIPVHKELNDLMQSIDQVMQNPHKSHQIIANSRQLVLNNLLPEHIYCYHFNLFRKYSKLLTTRVQLRPQMMRVFNETDVCKCAPNLRHEHEL
ncbi:unnamed protein product, partial [Oppiella nova]